jgi:hypothetical protein
MKRLMVFAIVILGCLCVAQDGGADFPAAVRIVFADGNSTQLSCTQDGNCRIVRNSSTSPAVTQVNLGFSGKHGYVLKVQ